MKSLEKSVKILEWSPSRRPFDGKYPILAMCDFTNFNIGQAFFHNERVQVTQAIQTVLKEGERD